MRFQVIIEQDDTGYYVAEVPALPGCLSQGRTIAEAKVNIKEAITGWVAVMNDKAKRRHAVRVQVAVLVIVLSFAPALRLLRSLSMPDGRWTVKWART